MTALARGARFTEAAHLYDSAVDSTTPAPIVLLRAHLYLRNDAAAAIRFLIKHRDPLAKRGSDARLQLYFAIGYARLGDFGQADLHFEKAWRCANANRDRVFAAELAYEQGRRLLLERRTTDAWTSYRQTLRDRSLRGQIRSEQLRSFILCQEEKYKEQASSLLKALHLIDRRRANHLEEWYLAVQTLALLARELPLLSAQLYAEEALEEIKRWPGDLAINHFQALKAIGWCKALTGDQLNCFRYLRRAQDVAPDAAWRAMVHLDRAYFARTAGEQQWSRNEIAQAEEIAEPVNWKDCQSEERVALLLFAELLSSLDKEKAAYYLARYHTLGKLSSPLLHFASDNRLKALADYATGVVREANGASAEAGKSFTSAWSTFDRISYDWRAGRAAAHLFGITSSKRWSDLARQKFVHYRRSWLWHDLVSLRPAKAGRAVKTLTPAQDRVFRLLCAGMSTDQIAKKLRCSKSTVRNHLKVVFKVMGVHSRAALVATAAKQGLV
ncbi:MAG: hypothetical protein JO233_02975 [Candidatus Eremiobacteraeota bacterium]|nr:hypothetical protein [Candidatus Eremiobacteraeota bacterium]